MYSSTLTKRLELSAYFLSKEDLRDNKARAIKNSSLIDYFGNKLLCLSQQCRCSLRLHQIANGLLNLNQL